MWCLNLQKMKHETAEVVTIEGEPMYNAIMSTLITVLGTEANLHHSGGWGTTHRSMLGTLGPPRVHFALEVA
jgi:hypothetical protein